MKILLMVFFVNSFLYAAQAELCKKDKYTAVTQGASFQWTVPSAKKGKKIEYECVSVENDTESSRMALFQGGKAEIVYVMIGETHSYTCDFKWTKKDKIFSVDIKSQPELRSFFEKNKKLMSGDRIEFNSQSKLTLANTLCSQAHQ